MNTGVPYGPHCSPRLKAYFLVICFVQERPDAILPTMGGQTGLNLAKALSEVCMKSC